MLFLWFLSDETTNEFLIHPNFFFCRMDSIILCEMNLETGGRTLLRKFFRPALHFGVLHKLSVLKSWGSMSLPVDTPVFIVQFFNTYLALWHKRCVV